MSSIHSAADAELYVEDEGKQVEAFRRSAVPPFCPKKEMDVYEVEMAE